MRHLFSVWTEGKNERERRREGDAAIQRREEGHIGEPVLALLECQTGTDSLLQRLDLDGNFDHGSRRTHAGGGVEVNTSLHELDFYRSEIARSERLSMLRILRCA